MAVAEEPYGAGLERVAIALTMAQAKAKPDGPQAGQRRFSRRIHRELWDMQLVCR